jgi:hypothetical protein
MQGYNDLSRLALEAEPDVDELRAHLARMRPRAAANAMDAILNPVAVKTAVNETDVKVN